MNREIKFRCWNKNKKCMMKVMGIDLAKPIFIYGIDYKKDRVYFKDLELMQFTGLKDKNSIEIFEGDIIRTYGYNDKWDDGAIGDVDWDEECGGFRFNWKILLAKSGEKDFRKPISTICSSSAYNSDEREGRIEVIGNIYENPELLEVKDEI